MHAPLRLPCHPNCQVSQSFPGKQHQLLNTILFLPLVRQIEEEVSLESSCDFGVVDNGEAQSALTEDRVKEDTQEEIKRPPLETRSVEVQTDAITNSELMSLQQQKM